MRRYVLASVALAALLTGGTVSAEPADELPDTLRLPTRVVSGLRQYLGSRPHDEVAALIGAMEACARVQVPAKGTIRDTGQCPEVSAARRADEERLEEVKRRATEEAAHKAPKD